jgi:uncharacterized protein (TIGR03435 family)
MRLLIVCAWTVITVALAAQDGGAPAFEVVSVKRNVSGDQASSSIVQPGGRYSATNMTLRMLMKTAYGVHDDQIAGGPDWLDSERYDIVAKAATDRPTNVFRDEARVMLRAALADRFGLELHRERREIPVYVLLLAMRDGGLGPNLRRSNPDDCGKPARPFPRAADAQDSTVDRPCGSGLARAGYLAARAMDVSFLTGRLGAWTDRVLVDRTGLSGTFDWDLQWTPDALSPDVTNSATAVPLVTALREQLGLRFEARREPAEVLVIDRASRPVPD